MKTKVFNFAIVFAICLLSSFSSSNAQNDEKLSTAYLMNEIQNYEDTGFVSGNSGNYVDPEFFSKGELRRSKNKLLSDNEKGSFVNVVSYPVPENGLDLGAALKNAITYPLSAIEYGIEGTVKVLCTIESNGTVSEVKVLDNIDQKLSQEVVQAVKSVAFKPAVQNGYQLKHYLIIPVCFKLI
jgi:periplasmic protein TonB